MGTSAHGTGRSTLVTEGGQEVPVGIAVRIARQAVAPAHEILGFYRDGLGLPEIGRFHDHEGYDGLILGLPGTGAHLEFTWCDAPAAPPHPESLLVLYLGDEAEVRRRLARLGAPTVPAANPYWDRHHRPRPGRVSCRAGRRHMAEEGSGAGWVAGELETGWRRDGIASFSAPSASGPRGRSEVRDDGFEQFF